VCDHHLDLRGAVSHVDDNATNIAMRSGRLDRQIAQRVRIRMQVEPFQIVHRCERIERAPRMPRESASRKRPLQHAAIRPGFEKSLFHYTSFA
jgi:hypothetical protein